MKPKAKSKSTKLSPKAQKSRKTEKESSKAITSLVQRSRQALEEGDLDLAHTLAYRACQILPQNSSNAHPIELLAEINVELGKFEEAWDCFLEAVKRRENVAPEAIELGDEGKFLWLGQMSSGEDAEKWFSQGIKVLQEVLGRTTDDAMRKLIHEKLSDGYCSLIELFLTDLCMIKEAEEKAEKCATLALEHNPDSPTALNLLASIRLSQTRNDEAQNLLEQSLLKWLGKPDVKPPIYDDRISFVKLLLEVELYEKALEVLETLQREDEDNVDLWYLYTCAYYHNNGESKEESWKSARECGQMCLKLYERENWDDEELQAHCQSILEEINKSGLSHKDDSEEEDGGEDEWEDTDDDVEMEDAD